MTSTTITDEATRFIGSMYDSFATGDADAWLDRITTEHEPLGIGTDPEEFWEGRGVLTSVIRAQLRELPAIGARFTAGDVRAQAHGDVVWVADRPTLSFPDGTSVPMRYSAVLVREADGLRWAQWHLSIGVANEEALDAELTTGA